MKFKFVPAFKINKKDLPTGSEQWPVICLREMETEGVLKGIEWELDEGVPGPTVENREELDQVVPGVLSIVRRTCESGKYDAIIILGGLDPGLYAAKEIGAQFGIPVVGCVNSEIAFAYVLGHKYTLIDALDCIATQNYHNILSYGMKEKCASLRSIEWSVADLFKNPSEAVEDFVKECIEAIEKDGADTIICGCTALMRIQPLAQKKLQALGYDVSILNSYKCAIEMAKALVSMRVCQSKIAFPGKQPKKMKRVIRP